MYLVQIHFIMLLFTAASLYIFYEKVMFNFNLSLIPMSLMSMIFWLVDSWQNSKKIQSRFYSCLTMRTSQKYKFCDVTVDFVKTTTNRYSIWRIQCSHIMVSCACGQVIVTSDVFTSVTSWFWRKQHNFCQQINDTTTETYPYGQGFLFNISKGRIGKHFGSNPSFMHYKSGLCLTFHLIDQSWTKSSCVWKWIQ